MMIKSKYVFKSATVGLALLLSTQAWAAQYLADGSTYSGNILTGTSSTYSPYSGSTPGGRTWTSSTNAPVACQGAASATAMSSAEVGAVHAGSFANAAASTSSGSANCGAASANAGATATARFMDSFVLQANGFAAGTQAILNGVIVSEGSMFNEGSGDDWGSRNFWQTSLSINGSTFDSRLEKIDGWAGPIVTGSGVFGVQAFSVVVTFGEIITLDMIARADFSGKSGYVSGNGYGFFNGSTDLSNTFYWGGISSLLVGGQQVSNFTAVSSSTNFNYANSYRPAVAAVPEPATWAMLIFGFGLVGALMRRQTRGPVAIV